MIIVLGHGGVDRLCFIKLGPTLLAYAELIRFLVRQCNVALVCVLCLVPLLPCIRFVYDVLRVNINLHLAASVRVLVCRMGKSRNPRFRALFTPLVPHLSGFNIAGITGDLKCEKRPSATFVSWIVINSETRKPNRLRVR